MPRRLYSLDVLRGIAALAVVLFHWRHFFFIDGVLQDGFAADTQPFFGALALFYRHGNQAVDLFFSLSGFIFFWLYAQDVTDRRVSGWRFFVLRFSRLYPLHLATLLVVIAGQMARLQLGQTFFVYQDNDAYHFVLNLLLASSVGLERGYSFNGPAWSISVEAVMYAAFFVACRWVRPPTIVLAVVSLLGFFVLADMYDPLARGVGSFFLGGCVYRLYAELVRRGAVKGAAGISGIATGLLWAIVFACNAGWAGGMALMPRFVEPTLVASVLLFPLTILSLALIETHRGPLGARVAILGDISYSSYLWHFPLQLLATLVVVAAGLSPGVFLSPVTLLLFFAALIAVSAASHRYLEMPAQRALRGQRRTDRPR